MPASFVLGSKKSSTYPRGYASGFFSPAALLADHFEQPAGTAISRVEIDSASFVVKVKESDRRRLILGGRICEEPIHNKSGSLMYDA